MTVPYEYFLTDVMPHVSDCPEPMALNAVKKAARDFLEKSLVWQEDLGPLDLGALQVEYKPVAPFGADIAMVLGVWLQDRPLRATTLEILNETEPGWRIVQASRPTTFMMTHTGNVRLLPEPTEDIAEALLIQAALKPNRLSLDLPDGLYLDWSEAICRGALARLFEVPGTTWFNPDLATYHDRQYRAGLMRAKGQKLKARTNVSLHAKPRAFV